MLGTDGQADRVLLDAHIGQFFIVELAVRGGSGVNDQALHIGNIGQQAEQLEVINKLESFLTAALDLESKDGAAAIGEVSLI